MSRYLNRLVEIAGLHGGHTAVQEADRTTTYAEFLDLARRYAGAFSSRKAVPRILCHLNPGADAYAAMFGAGYAGGVYSPVNTGQPIAKRRMIAKIFAPDIVVSDRQAARELGIRDDRIIPPTDIGGPANDYASPQHDLAFVIFTSGSTGTPKGVAIGRSALDHYVNWIGDAIVPTPADRWSQHPNIGFDLSVLDIYGALCFGATLVPLQSSFDRLMPGQAIEKYRLTIWNSVPSVLDLMIAARQLTAEKLATLRLATFCGEPLRREHLAALFAARPDLVVHNTYGPTEATVSCTLRRITAQQMEAVCGTSIALGDPIRGMSLELVGGVDGSEGEIVLSGPQLAAGYWGDETQTAASFRRISGADGERRVYHTGDWAKIERGELFFVERIDNQIKIKGHRLDLAEVDAAFGKCGALAACCLFHEGEIHAFVQVHYGQRTTAEVLRTRLAEYLEPHAIPQHFHFVDALPRNDNDKINRQDLRRRLVEVPAGH